MWKVTAVLRSMHSQNGKVFGIGLFKTGLTSLGKALSILGYRFSGDEWYHGKITDDPWNLCPRFTSQELGLLTERAGAYDAHVDYPWMFVYQEMDKAFPGSRFIYTMRDPELLAVSNRNHHRQRGASEADIPSKERIIQRYFEHKRMVLDYFYGRSELVTVDWSAGSGWDELCGFLGRRKPDQAFAWENKGTYEPSRETCGRR
jgi:hypothetical protein